MFASHAFGATDSVLLSEVPPTATVLTGIDVRRAGTTASGQYVLKQTVAEPAIARMLALTGIDFSRDVRHALLAGIGKHPSFDSADLTLLAGSFDMNRLIRTSRSRGASVAEYRGSTMVTSRAGAATIAITAPKPGILMVGKLATVQMTLDSVGRPIDSQLEHQAVEVGHSNDLWFATILSGSFLAQQINDNLPEQLREADAFQSIVRSCGGLRFGHYDQASVVLATGSESDAQMLSVLLRVLGRLAHLPLGGLAGTALAQAALSSMEVSKDGSAVHASSTISDSQLAAALASGS